MLGLLPITSSLLHCAAVQLNYLLLGDLLFDAPATEAGDLVQKLLIRCVQVTAQ